MAKATTKKVTTETVTLELSMTEAVVLSAMLGHVGGHPASTARGVTARVRDAMSSAGVAHTSDLFEGTVRGLTLQTDSPYLASAA